MKTILPWLCAIVLAIGLAAQYGSNRKQAAELAQLREEAEKLRAGAEQPKASPQTESDELVQLRKDHEDLLRLRNEVRLLRDEKQQLAKQVQAAKPASANPQQQQSQQQLQQLMAENQQLRAQSQANQAVACINNLRQIESAKQQWAAANGRPAGSLVSPQDIASYFPNKTVPACPAGGVYTLNPIGISPICNIPGHVLQK